MYTSCTCMESLNIAVGMGRRRGTQKKRQKEAMLKQGRFEGKGGTKTLWRSQSALVPMRTERNGFIRTSKEEDP